MNAGQIVRILQSVDPETDVSFSVGYDTEERKNLLKIVGNDPDIFTDLTIESIEISSLLRGRLRVDVTIFSRELTSEYINSIRERGDK